MNKTVTIVIILIVLAMVGYVWYGKTHDAAMMKGEADVMVK